MDNTTLLPLLRGKQIPLDDALESDILDQLKWPAEMLDFCYDLYSRISEIQLVVWSHLRIPLSDRKVGDFK